MTHIEIHIVYMGVLGVAKRRLRVEDQLEYNLRDLSEKLKLINKIVVVVILAFGMFLGVKSCNTYNNTIGKMYDSFNDLSSLFGSSMSLDKPGQKIYVPENDWVCAGCGKVHRSYVTSCPCGLKKGEAPAENSAPRIVYHNSANKAPSQTTDWTCACCGSLQPQDAIFCSNCGNRKN